MERISLSTGRTFIFEVLTLAEYKPSKQNLVDPKQVDPSELRIEFPGNVFAILHGKEADEMLSRLK